MHNLGWFPRGRRPEGRKKMAEKIKPLDKKSKKDKTQAIPPGWLPFIKSFESLGPEEIKMLKKLDAHHIPAKVLRKKIAHSKNKG